MSTCTEVAIAQVLDRDFWPEPAPQGWVSAHLLHSQIARSCDLNPLIVSQTADALRKRSPDWFRMYFRNRVNERGEGIGPLVWYREDSAEWLVSVCVKIRELLDREIAEVTGRPVSDQ